MCGIWQVVCTESGLEGNFLSIKVPVIHGNYVLML